MAKAHHARKRTIFRKDVINGGDMRKHKPFDALFITAKEWNEAEKCGRKTKGKIAIIIEGHIQMLQELYSEGLYVELSSKWPSIRKQKKQKLVLSLQELEGILGNLRDEFSSILRDNYSDADLIQEDRDDE